MHTAEACYLDLRAELSSSEAKILRGRVATTKEVPLLWKIIEVGWRYGGLVGRIRKLINKAHTSISKIEESVKPGAPINLMLSDLLGDFIGLRRDLQGMTEDTQRLSSAKQFSYYIRTNQKLIAEMDVLIKRLENKLALQTAYQGIFSEDLAVRSKAEDDLVHALLGADCVAQDSLR